MLISGNILSDISDHFSQFCILSSIVDQPKESRKVRDFSNFSYSSFIADLIQVDWDEIIARGTDNINKISSSFYNKLNKIVNKHAPFKTISKRRKKKLSKPWITKGIRTSIKIKNRLYMCGDHAQYKHYCNTISKLTRISKRQFYSQFFTNNLKIMQKTWEGINTLLNRKKKTSMEINCLKQPNSNTTVNIKSRISNIMNEHFTGIGPTLANNLPTPKNPLLNFLTKTNHLQLHFSFVRYLQTKLNWKFFLCLTKKSYGFYSCPVSILKHASDIISDVLSKILNKSIDLATFPSKLKMAKVIPIFKSDDNTDPNNYRPISLSWAGWVSEIK